MIKAIYSELDGPDGVTRQLSIKGHAGYAPAGQDIVCAGASILTQALVYLAAGTEGVKCSAGDSPDGPRITVMAAPGASGTALDGGFELVKAGLSLLAERYPDNLRFADTSPRAERSMVDLQLFAEDGAEAAPAAPALSRAQERQAIAAGTLRPRAAQSEAAAPHSVQASPPPTPEKAVLRAVQPAQSEAGRFIQALHRQWAREEAALRKAEPDFSFRQALKNPAMRRMMRMPGMRMQDAYRAAHYERLVADTARSVEQGVMERIRERGTRPAENGARSGAALSAPDVSKMTRAQREALEREVLHGATIRL